MKFEVLKQRNQTGRVRKRFLLFTRRSSFEIRVDKVDRGIDTNIVDPRVTSCRSFLSLECYIFTAANNDEKLCYLDIENC